MRYHDKSKGKVSVLLFIDPDAQAKVQDKEALTSKRALERARMNEEAADFINRISGEFKQVKFVIISLEDKDKTDKFLKDKAIQVETLIEEDGEVSHEYGVTHTPSMIVVDKEKKIRTMYRGFTDKTGETVARDLKALSAKEERK